LQFYGDQVVSMRNGSRIVDSIWRTRTGLNPYLATKYFGRVQVDIVCKTHIGQQGACRILNEGAAENAEGLSSATTVCLGVETPARPLISPMEVHHLDCTPSPR
jgi:hypothetical protein